MILELNRLSNLVILNGSIVDVLDNGWYAMVCPLTGCNSKTGMEIQVNLPKDNISMLFKDQYINHTFMFIGNLRIDKYGDMTIQIQYYYPVSKHRLIAKHKPVWWDGVWPIPQEYLDIHLKEL